MFITSTTTIYFKTATVLSGTMSGIMTYGSKGIIPGTWSGLLIAMDIRTGAVTGCMSAAIASTSKNIPTISLSYVIGAQLNPIAGALLGSSLSTLYNTEDKQNAEHLCTSALASLMLTTIPIFINGMYHKIISGYHIDLHSQFTNTSTDCSLNTPVPGQLTEENQDNMTIINL